MASHHWRRSDRHALGRPIHGGVSATMALALLLVTPLTAAAVDQTVLGTSFVLRNPSTPDKRALTLNAKELASDNTIVGDPVANGAILAIAVNGASPSYEEYVLPAGPSPSTHRPFWKGDATRGFTYGDRAGENGPVKKAQIKLRNGVFLIKASLGGRLAALTLTPPNLGTDACVQLALGGGDSYSVAFTSGTVTNRGATWFQVVKPTSAGSCARLAMPGLSIGDVLFPYDPFPTDPDGYVSHEVTITPLEDPSGSGVPRPNGWFWMAAFFVNLGSGQTATGYMGLQTSAGGAAGPLAHHKCAIFSIWGGTSSIAGSGPDDATYPPFHGGGTEVGGTFQQTLIYFPWEAGTPYDFQVAWQSDGTMRATVDGYTIGIISGLGDGYADTTPWKKLSAYTRHLTEGYDLPHNQFCSTIGHPVARFDEISSNGGTVLPATFIPILSNTNPDPDSFRICPAAFESVVNPPALSFTETVGR